MAVRLLLTYPSLLEIHGTVRVCPRDQASAVDSPGSRPRSRLLQSHQDRVRGFLSHLRALLKVGEGQLAVRTYGASMTTTLALLLLPPVTRVHVIAKDTQQVAIVNSGKLCVEHVQPRRSILIRPIVVFGRPSLWAVSSAATLAGDQIHTCHRWISSSLY